MQLVFVFLLCHHVVERQAFAKFGVWISECSNAEHCWMSRRISGPFARRINKPAISSLTSFAASASI